MTKCRRVNRQPDAGDYITEIDAGDSIIDSGCWRLANRQRM